MLLDINVLWLLVSTSTSLNSHIDSDKPLHRLVNFDSPIKFKNQIV